MKRPRKFLAILIVASLVGVALAVPLNDDVGRVRIIMDLILDDDVTNPAAYAAADKAPPAIAVKYADAVIRVYGEVSQEALDRMSNDEKARNYIRLLRNWHREAHASLEVAKDTPVASRTARTRAGGESDTEVGPKEELEIPPEPET